MFGRHHLALALVATALAIAPAPVLAQRASVALAPASSPESVGFSSERLERLDAAMAKAVADGRVAGMTTLLARHGKIVAFNTYGQASLAEGRPLEKDAIFRIYSMTKPITGVAMMILFEEGRWRLDDPVSRYLPELKDLKVMTGVDASGAPILEPAAREPTMRELMSHTAGFGYGLSDDQIAAMLQDGFATAQQDMAARALVEARVDADRLLMATRSALQIDGDVLSATERAAIDDLMARLSQCLQDPAQNSAAVVEAATKALADGTEAFAAQRMNRGIQQALAGRRVQDI